MSAAFVLTVLTMDARSVLGLTRLLCYLNIALKFLRLVGESSFFVFPYLCNHEYKLWYQGYICDDSAEYEHRLQLGE